MPTADKTLKVEKKTFSCTINAYEGYVIASTTADGVTTYTQEVAKVKFTAASNGAVTYLSNIDNSWSKAGTYQLLDDISWARVPVSANVTLDLNGHTWTSTQNSDFNVLFFKSGSNNLTLNIVDTSAGKGGKIVNTTANGIIGISNSGNTVNIGEGVILEGNSVVITGTNNTLNVEGTINGGNTFAIATNGIQTTNATINIKSGAVITSNDVAVYLPGTGTTTVEDGATITGATAIYQKSGTLNISGGTINGTGAAADFTHNGDGANATGDAIVVESCDYPGGTPTTVITGNPTITSANGAMIADHVYTAPSASTETPEPTITSQSNTITLPEGEMWIETTTPGTYTIGEAVAKIGDTKYATLPAAVAAAANSQTITLLADISLTDRLFINAGATPAYAGTGNRYATTTENKSITLDLNGHNIESSSNIALAGGSLNITNTGTADATHGVISTTENGLAPIEVRGTGDLTQKRTLTIGTGVTLSGKQYGLNVFGSNDANKNIIDVTVGGTVKGMLFVLGNLKNTENNINITVNGTVTTDGLDSTDEDPLTGIALNGNANVTIEDGATVIGESGIEVRAGKLTVNGGTITGTATDYSYNENGNGTTTKGAAIAVAQHTTILPVDVKLNGGTLAGKELIAVTDVNGNSLNDVSVTAATSFVQNTETELPGGMMWVDNGNGTYSIGFTPVQVIHANNTIDGYLTLAEAFDNVVADETIKLMADVTMSQNITLPTNANGTFKLDFNSHTITRGDYNIKLSSGQAVLTNVETQVFAPVNAEDYVVVKEASGDNTYPHKYNVVMSISSPKITVTVADIVYDGKQHLATGDNAIKVTVYDSNLPGPLQSGDAGAYTLSLVPTSNYNLADFGNSADNVYKYARTYKDAIIIEGKPGSLYAGMRTADLVISPRNINDVTVEGHSQPYTETGYTANDDATTGIKKLVTLKYNNIPLVVTTDYTIDVDDTKTYKTAGTYPEVITITAVEGGNFTGSRKVNFYIGNSAGIDIATCNVEATTVYNGSEQTPTGAGTNPTLIVKNPSTNAVLVQGTDYTITTKSETGYEYTNAKTYTDAITIAGIGDYYGTKTVDYIITPKDIAGCAFTTSTPFTGSVIVPADVVVVKDGSTDLTKDTHYTITVSTGYTYQDPGTYANALTITGKGNYTGEVTKDFTITPEGAIDLANAAVVISKQTYTGADLKPTAATTTVTVNGQALSSDDYNFSFVQEGDNFYKDAKVYSNAIIITAKTTQTTYYGTAVGNYIIEPRDLSDAGITVTTTDIDYNNAEHDVAVTVKYGENVIPATNYTFDPTKVTEAGTYTITVNAVENSNLVGSTTTTQKVTKSLGGTYATDFTVSPDPIPTQTATGSEIKPTIVVKDKDREMIKTDEYTLSYADNTDEGTATITITGTGVYSGTKLVNFTIVNEFFVLEGITYHHANEGEEVTVGKKDGDNYVPAIASNLAPKVTIPSTVTYQNKVFTVVGADEKAFGNAAITALTLPSTIKSITPSAFEGSTNMRYVDATAATELTPNSLDRTISGTTFYGLPKQSLVFLNGNTITGENYIYKVGDNDFRCDEFKIYDDVNGNQQVFTEADGYKWAYENLYPFTANTIENTRQLKAGQHYTVCLPYDLPIPSTLKAYTLDASSSTILGFKEVTGTLEAFTPYVVIASGTGNLLSISTGGQVPATTFASDDAATRLTPAGAGTTNYVLVGTMRYMDGNAAQGNYIMQGDKTWKKIASDSNFNGPCILPMRAYIAPMASIPGSGARLTATFTNADGSTTAIRDLQLDNDGDDTFDLQGRKVNGQSAAKGVYIKNGKKLYK